MFGRGSDAQEGEPSCARGARARGMVAATPRALLMEVRDKVVWLWAQTSDAHTPTNVSNCCSKPNPEFTGRGRVSVFDRCGEYR